MVICEECLDFQGKDLPEFFKRTLKMTEICPDCNREKKCYVIPAWVVIEKGKKMEEFKCRMCHGIFDIHNMAQTMKNVCKLCEETVYDPEDDEEF